ncbi:MAG: endopeptidase La [Spirochaetia bacterium]|nr:endopeptidase La [Spirochaetia bacterium]
MTDQMLVSVDQLLPDQLHVIPIRYRPVFPGMIMPLVISGAELTRQIEKFLKNTNFLGLLMQKDDELNEISVKNLYTTGTVCRVIKKINLPEGGIHLLVNSITRFKVVEYINVANPLLAKVNYHHDQYNAKDKELQALTRAVLTKAKEIAAQSPLFTEEMKVTLVNVEEPGKIGDFVCSLLNLEKVEFQKIMDTFDVKKRLELALVYLSREMELLKIQKKIQYEVEEKIDHQQKDYYLREQLKAIREELGLGGPKDKDAEYYLKKIEATPLPEEALEKAKEEVARFEYVDPHSSEYGVIRNYLDTLLELPWVEPPFKDINLDRARKILDKDHFGLNDVKERIIEHLAVRKHKKDVHGTIICFVGPPGVGKTSLGKSIAHAMGKKFFRFSLGGMKDEAEIKGHRRTYVGAMPGKVISALKVVKSKDPVIMLDEIDKLGVSFQGDPASALLEVLDPEQNRDFRDHFLDLPFDLSLVTFITTANTLDTIPSPLLDRMEVIRLAGYILEEKIKIVQKYIIPRVLEKVGLTTKTAPELSLNSLKFIIESYSREAGIRSVEKMIEKIYRKAVSALESRKPFPKNLTIEETEKVLGPPVFSLKEEAVLKYPGCALGLAWTSMGGTTLIIESRSIAGKGNLKLTGQLGKVMLESADIALTYVKTIIQDDDYWSKRDVHIHVPDGATPKDGPSAGITITTALYSLYKNKIPKQGFAMTGEIRLTGQVLPIGGLKEKVIAARRIGIKKIIFPQENEKDWKDLPEYLKKNMAVFPVSHYDEVKKLLF